MDQADYPPKTKTSAAPTRVVTAASLFDGHDAAINIMRRILQQQGCEVIHLGHNRSVADIVKAGIDEDAHAIAISSYQGGHNEFFRYMVELLDSKGCGHIKVFGGGGGVIVPDEIRSLQDAGVERIYSPEDGRRLGLVGMIADMVERSSSDVTSHWTYTTQDIVEGSQPALARAISIVEAASEGRVELPDDLSKLLSSTEGKKVPVVGITGTGGAGKSSLTDELLRRFLTDRTDERVAVISVDPTRKRTGGALLGDRIRMNSARHERCFVRSMATRLAGAELSRGIQPAIQLCQAAGFDLIIVETSGIGQGSSAITEVSDVHVYVMTPEYGAASQLEKIDMLDFADMIVINKFDRRGAEDALRDVSKQVQRNRQAFDVSPDEMPVFGTIAAQFNDAGVNAAYRCLMKLTDERQQRPFKSTIPDPLTRCSPPQQRVIPPNRIQYLGDIVHTVRQYHQLAEHQAAEADKLQHLNAAVGILSEDAMPTVKEEIAQIEARLEKKTTACLLEWDQMQESYAGNELTYSVRGKDIHQPLTDESLSGLPIPRIALPNHSSHGDRVKWMMRENLPGKFPYTAGTFPLKRRSEEPKRMFAGEGGPAKTNARFHYLCKGEPVHRLSTAFDSVTLYGQDPDERPDIYGKIGESGVSIATLDDMKVLYSGFDLCAPSTSVSMTINGPAPIILAMFLNTAIDQQVDIFTNREGRAPTDAEYSQIRSDALRVTRGTVQADILKEDQAQNTCIFSLEFALRMMGDIQAWFIENEVRNYYSVSVSGYHIAEAGANPISQLAFTLSNGFTLVEYYRSRGMDINAFAPNLSFFFSNGMDPEYTVIGRVARRIWAIAMDRMYGANQRSQKLKYHIQTSGRSLHAREIQFNDIRTTLQALLAIQDQCNSLHTNAYDEAVTTPTEESVRRAMAIQKIVNQEFGVMKNENSTQGSFFVEALTELVEAAVLEEFERIDQRGGVLGAMETQYQRGKIQQESLHYEHQKHSGELPLVGINTFVDPQTTAEGWEPPPIELRRASPEEKDDQIARLRNFQAQHAGDTAQALERLQRVATDGGNIFAELMSTVRVASLGQITSALYEVGGEYRRSL
ncbi:MAG: methylmalonyl-CoA mutase [Deltaproteobacteria bacterium]|nr:methylmalonyl-CoA mutase [Deltaproteobacteria bacterium]